LMSQPPRNAFATTCEVPRERTECRREGDGHYNCIWSLLGYAPDLGEWR